MAPVVRNMLSNTRDIRDMGLISGSGRYPGGGNGNPLQYSCLGIPWTEEPGGLPSMPWGGRRVGNNLVTKQQEKKNRNLLLLTNLLLFKGDFLYF